MAVSSPAPVAALDRAPVAAALGGAVCIAFSAIFVRLSHTAPPTSATFRCAYALPLLALLAARERRRLGPRRAADRRLGLIAGVFFAADLLCWHQAIADVGAGLATVLGNLQVVLVGPIAWVAMRERPGGRVLGAIPIVFVGVVLISGALGSAAYGDDPARGALFGVFTGLSYAGFILLLRQAAGPQKRLVAPLWEATAVAAPLCALVGIALGEIDFVPTWPGHAWLVLLALTSQVLGWLLISSGLPRLPAAVTSVLLTLQPVGSVTLGVILLGERPSGVQLLGVALVLSGLILATARRSGGGATAPEPA
jgi:drug/metabolite transporter (DMT)-like permease